MTQRLMDFFITDSPALAWFSLYVTLFSFFIIGHIVVATF